MRNSELRQSEWAPTVCEAREQEATAANLSCPSGGQFKEFSVPRSGCSVLQYNWGGGGGVGLRARPDAAFAWVAERRAAIENSYARSTLFRTPCRMGRREGVGEKRVVWFLGALHIYLSTRSVGGFGKGSCR